MKAFLFIYFWVAWKGHILANELQIIEHSIRALLVKGKTETSHHESLNVIILANKQAILAAAALLCVIFLDEDMLAESIFSELP